MRESLIAYEFATEDDRDTHARRIGDQFPSDWQVVSVDQDDEHWWVDLPALGDRLWAAHRALVLSGAQAARTVDHGGAAREVRANLARFDTTSGALPAHVSAAEAVLHVTGPALVFQGPGFALAVPQIPSATSLTSRRSVEGATEFDERTLISLQSDIEAAAQSDLKLSAFAADVSLAFGVRGTGPLELAGRVDHASFDEPPSTVIGIRWDLEPCSNETLVVRIDGLNLDAFSRLARAWDAQLIAHVETLGMGFVTQVREREGFTSEKSGDADRFAMAPDTLPLDWIARAEGGSARQTTEVSWIDLVGAESNSLPFAITSGIRSASSLLAELGDTGLGDLRSVVIPNEDIRWGIPRPRGTARDERARVPSSTPQKQVWAWIQAANSALLYWATLTARGFDRSIDEPFVLVDGPDERFFLDLDGANLAVLRELRIALRRAGIGDAHTSLASVAARNTIGESPEQVASPSRAQDPRLLEPFHDGHWSCTVLLGSDALDQIREIYATEPAIELTELAPGEDVLAMDYRDVAALVRDLRSHAVGGSRRLELVDLLENWLDVRWTAWRGWWSPATVIGFRDEAAD